MQPFVQLKGITSESGSYITKFQCFITGKVRKVKNKLLIAAAAAVLAVSAGTAFAEFSSYTVYRGRGWHFDSDEKKAPFITVVPRNEKEPQVYGDGFVKRVEPESKPAFMMLKN